VLPYGWEERCAPDNTLYYYNTVTKDVSYDVHPSLFMANDWRKCFNDSGEEFYYNDRTGATTWRAPSEAFDDDSSQYFTVRDENDLLSQGEEVEEEEEGRSGLHLSPRPKPPSTREEDVHFRQAINATEERDGSQYEHDERAWEEEEEEDVQMVIPDELKEHAAESPDMQVMIQAMYQDEAHSPHQMMITTFAKNQRLKSTGYSSNDAGDESENATDRTLEGLGMGRLGINSSLAESNTEANNETQSDRVVDDGVGPRSASLGQEGSVTSVDETASWTSDQKRDFHEEFFSAPHGPDDAQVLSTLAFGSLSTSFQQDSNSFREIDHAADATGNHDDDKQVLENEPINSNADNLDHHLTPQLEEAPELWSQREDQYGVVYYENTLTGETSWVKPNPSSTNALDPSDSGANTWQMLFTPDGIPYYFNFSTGESRWTRPQVGLESDDIIEELAAGSRNRSNSQQYGQSNTESSGLGELPEAGGAKQTAPLPYLPRRATLALHRVSSSSDSSDGAAEGDVDGAGGDALKPYLIDLMDFDKNARVKRPPQQQKKKKK
jgi:hypothetical protein